VLVSEARRMHKSRTNMEAYITSKIEKAETMLHSAEDSDIDILKSALALQTAELKKIREMDMDRALVAARTLYRATGDIELKGVMDRAELCWGKWNDASDYRMLMEKCACVMSELF